MGERNPVKKGLYGDFMCRDISKPHMAFPGFKLPKMHPDRSLKKTSKSGLQV